jgi:glyoxylase-like metal-dependent hydrolase (beta-lactamase superfamily II)
MTLLVACIGGGDVATEPAPTDKSTEPATDAPTEPVIKPTEPVDEMDKSKFNLLYGKEYVCAFVLPDESTDVENAVADELAKIFLNNLKKKVVFIKESELTDDLPYVLLLGNTLQQESKDAIAALGEREATVTAVGNKLVVAFCSLSSGKGVVRSLMGDIERDESYKEAALPLDYSLKYKALPEIDALPTYEGTNTTMDSGLDTTLLIADSMNIKTFDDYCADIEAADFKRESDRTQGSNRFVTFLAENHYIYLYRTGYNSQVRVITGPIEQYAREDYTEDLKENKTPYIASIPQPGDGEGYILRLPDGRFIIFDGGYKGEDRVYNTLRELDSGDIVIAAWFISHPHGDHYPALIDFIRDHGDDRSITIQRIMHNYTHHERYNINGSAGLDTSGTNVQELYTALETYADEVPIIKVHTGQVINFGSASIEIMYTIEDLMPNAIPNINDSSLVIRVHMADQSIMLLADTCYDSGPIMNNIWGSYLKSDIMQIAHHGQWPSVAEIYHSIKADIILFPAKTKNVKQWVVDSRWSAVMQVALGYAKDIYISGDSIEILELPLAIQYNKEDVLDMLANLK